MTLADRLPTFDDAALVNLRSNAIRLSVDTTDDRQEDAVALLPLIEAEIAGREARKPPKPLRRSPRKSAGVQ